MVHEAHNEKATNFIDLLFDSMAALGPSNYAWKNNLFEDDSQLEVIFRNMKESAQLIDD